MKVAGGAEADCREYDGSFQIGKRNLITLRKLLWKNGVLLKAHDVGGCCSRTMSLDIAGGSVRIESEEGIKDL